MTSNTPDLLEKIRAKCIEVNPEIVELKFGCEIALKGVRKHFYLSGDSNGSHHLAIGGVEIPLSNKWFVDNCKIIGRPIRLADVLLAIGAIDGVHATVSTKGQIDVHPFNGDTVWNLRKDSAEDQSPECIAFISSILGV